MLTYMKNTIYYFTFNDYQSSPKEVGYLKYNLFILGLGITGTVLY
jgi:hypothetical protein